MIHGLFEDLINVIDVAINTLNFIEWTGERLNYRSEDHAKSKANYALTADQVERILSAIHL